MSMTMIITGVVMGLFGIGNLTIGRRFPERINASFQRGLGWVGIFCGVVALLFGTLMILFPVPVPVPVP